MTHPNCFAPCVSRRAIGIAGAFVSQLKVVTSPWLTVLHPPPSPQILPFTLLLCIFGITWKYISFFGTVVLYLGVLNLILGRRVEMFWRLLLLACVVISVFIVLFDMAAFSHVHSPTLYWLGLRRGDYVPNPEGEKGEPCNRQQSSSHKVRLVHLAIMPTTSRIHPTHSAPPFPPRSGIHPSEGQGWQLSPSAEAYVVIAFLCALQYFYHTPPSPAPDSARVAAARSATPPFMRPSPTLSIDTALANEVASASGSPRAASPRSPGAVTSRPVSPTGHAVIDNTRALRPAVDSFMVRIPTSTHHLIPCLI